MARLAAFAVLIPLLLFAGCGDPKTAPPSPSRGTNSQGTTPAEDSPEYTAAFRAWSDEITAAQIALADCLKTANSQTDAEAREAARSACRRTFEERARTNDETFRKFKQGK